MKYTELKEGVIYNWNDEYLVKYGEKTKFYVGLRPGNKFVTQGFSHYTKGADSLLYKEATSREIRQYNESFKAQKYVEPSLKPIFYEIY